MKSNESVRGRLEAVEGLLRLQEQWSEVTEAVATARDRAHALAKLQAPPFVFTDLQAVQIMDCPVGRRTELARSDLANERRALLDQLEE